MTPVELVSASDGSATLRDLPPNPGQTYLVRAVGTQAVGSLTFDVRYYFEQGERLSIVELSATSGCGQAIDGLIGKYGQPTRSSRTATSAIVWFRSDADNLSIQSTSSGLSCTIRYRPLRLTDDRGL